MATSPTEQRRQLIRNDEQMRTLRGANHPERSNTGVVQKPFHAGGGGDSDWGVGFSQRHRAVSPTEWGNGVRKAGPSGASLLRKVTRSEKKTKQRGGYRSAGGGTGVGQPQLLSGPSGDTPVRRGGQQQQQPQGGGAAGGLEHASHMVARAQHRGGGPPPPSLGGLGGAGGAVAQEHLRFLTEKFGRLSNMCVNLEQNLKDERALREKAEARLHAATAATAATAAGGGDGGRDGAPLAGVANGDGGGGGGDGGAGTHHLAGLLEDARGELARERQERVRLQEEYRSLEQQCAELAAAEREWREQSKTSSAAASERERRLAGEVEGARADLHRLRSTVQHLEDSGASTELRADTRDAEYALLTETHGRVVEEHAAMTASYDKLKDEVRLLVCIYVCHL